jgi:hypothetical protein
VEGKEREQALPARGNLEWLPAAAESEGVKKEELDQVGDIRRHSMTFCPAVGGEWQA